jgi:uncharacterized membrane protein YbhN (UPF0104 family)
MGKLHLWWILIKDNWRSSWKVVLGFTISLLVLVFLVIRAYAGLRQFLEAGIVLHYKYLLISLSFQTIGVLVVSAVWGAILARVGIMTGYFYNLRVYCVSALARKLPGVVWYAVGRLVLYNWKVPHSAPTVTIALAIEVISLSLSGIILFIFSTTTGLIQIPGVNPSNQLLFLLSILIILAILFGPRLIQWGTRKIRERSVTSNEVDDLSIGPFDAIKWLTGDMITIAMGAGVIYFLIRAINPDLQVPYVALLGVWALTLAIAPFVIWIPASYLLGDGLLYLVLTLYAGDSMAALITLTWRLWAILLELGFGLISGISLGKTGDLRPKKSTPS